MMTQSTLAARALLKEYWNFTIPISPKEYAENLGLLPKISDLSSVYETRILKKPLQL